MSSALKPLIIKALAMKSGNRCAFPACPQRLYIEGGNTTGGAVIGEAAHIAGEKPGARRYDASMTDAQRNGLANLVFLCTNHHTEIDKPGTLYTTAEITLWKIEHEKRIDDAVFAAMPEVTFSELDIVTRTIAAGQYQHFDGDFTVLSPTDKMQRNGLTNRSRAALTMGLAAAPIVGAFVSEITKTVPSFEGGLKKGFQTKYDSLGASGVKGDALFDELCMFSSKYSSDLQVRAASLAVVAYLFEACDVFEK